MAGIGALVAALGIIGIIYGLIMRAKVGRVSGAPFVKTGEAAANPSAAGPKGAISVEGSVECTQPLVAPCSGIPCLHYELKVTGSWKEGDTSKSKEYLHEKRAAQFALNDGSGPVQVRADEGGDFEPSEKTFDETKKEGFLADLKSAIGKGQPIMFGQYAFQNPTMSKADKFECVERILRVQPRLYANGRIEGGVIQAPGWRSLILDARGRDQVLGSAAKTSKVALMIGGGAIVVGTAVGLIGNFMASGAGEATSPSQAAIAAPPAVTETTAAPAETIPPSETAELAAAPATAAAGAKPTAEKPTAKVATAEKPTAKQPTAKVATAEKPTAEKPTAEKPTAKVATAEKPTAEKPTAKQPTAEQPPAKQPTAEKPPAKQPTAEKPPAEK